MLQPELKIFERFVWSYEKIIFIFNKSLIHVPT